MFVYLRRTISFQYCQLRACVRACERVCMCSRLRAEVSSGPSGGTVGFEGGLFKSMGVWFGQLMCFR